MNHKLLPGVLALAATWMQPLTALAHEGHGLAGASHWHATDVLGFLALGAGAAALLWWRNRK